MMRLTAFVIGMTAALALGTATAATPADKRLESAADIVQKINAMPDRGIPKKLLDSAYGIAVLPNVIKAGFIIAGRYGKGVLVVRQPDGRWGNPAFISMAGGSVGWQVGAQGSDLILVFKSRKSVEGIAKGRFTLGGDATATAGPVGRTASAGTDVSFKAEIYSYSRSRGLFAGVSVEGASISMDKKSNATYYPGVQGDAMAILTNPNILATRSAQRFIDVLSSKAPSIGPAVAGIQSDGVKTYAIDEAAPADSDLTF